MAKKTHIKVRMVPESKPDSAFVYYAKKPTKGEKAKIKLKIKNIIPIQGSTNFLLKKNCLRIVNNYFLKFLYSYLIQALIIDFHTSCVI